MYKQQRNYHNQQKMMFNGVGEYGIPKIHRDTFDIDNLYKNSRWIGFNQAKTEKHPEECVAHFFLDDYQFERLWKSPDTYLRMLSKFKAVCAPDFSLYTDFPKAINIYNHFRKHWVSAYLQSYGIKIIPTLCWSDERSFDYCFDGLEDEYDVCIISTTGTQNQKEKQKLFDNGIMEALKRVNVKNLFVVGEVQGDALLNCNDDVLNTNIYIIPNQQIQRLRRINKNDKT